MKGNVLYSDVVHLGNIQLGIGHSIWGEGGRGKVELSEKISAFFCMSYPSEIVWHRNVNCTWIALL